jgi:hypothetical protein
MVPGQKHSVNEPIQTENFCYVIMRRRKQHKATEDIDVVKPPRLVADPVAKRGVSCRLCCDDGNIHVRISASTSASHPMCVFCSIVV